MEIVHTNNFRDLIRFRIPIGIGTTAKCYRGKDGDVIKIFKNNGDARILLNTDNFPERLEEIGAISNKTFVGPEKLIYQDGKLIGYIYKYIKGRELEHLSCTTKVSKLFRNIDIVFENIKKVSDANFLLKDVHGKNILFDGDYHIIDLDRGYFTDFYDKDEIYENNMREVFITIMDMIYGLKPWHTADYYNVDVNNYRYNHNINNELVKKLFEEYKKVCRDDDPSLRKIRKYTLDKKYINPYEEY